jgi:Mg2+-importing ATPase
MIFVFSASMALFQTGWFIESMITQVFVVFVIRTRKIPFFKSKPGKALLASSIIIALVTILIPFTGLGKIFGFTAPPLLYFGILILMVVTYLVLVEIGKYWFFKKYEI